MNTPICDFVSRYSEQSAMRLHMPGHKGQGFLGFEHLDITEIEGADSLYNAQGIIRESEQNASELFGCETLYSTEGSSLCIRAMLYLVALYAKKENKKPLIFAGRNAHSTFLSAVALLELQVQWLYPQMSSSYLSCNIDAPTLDKILTDTEDKPVAVYLTSPDYLGNMADISAVAQVCHRHGILLLVDNAHGAYLRFLEKSQHPMDLGADMCCDSAHKTLPVLTGGAYLHISAAAPKLFSAHSKQALHLFGSTSPSYLILQSLDKANEYLHREFPRKLREFLPQVQMLKEKLTDAGYTLIGQEELKITLSTKPYGYRGVDFAKLLSDKNIICEFADPDFVVLMLGCDTADYTATLLDALLSIPTLTPIEEIPPLPSATEAVMSLREAMLSDSEIAHAENSLGRILSYGSISCPPAVPVAVCGERIDEKTLEAFRYYGIKTCSVIKEQQQF